MFIRYGKGKNGKPDTLTCVRDDGTTTWEHSAVGIKHDLLHYAVETTLGFREGFYGLVAVGRDIADFGTREGQKDALPAEAEWAESIVGLLQWPALAGAPGLSDAEFFAMLEQTCGGDGRHAPRVTPEQLARTREQARSLHAAWNRLAPGETLELVFGRGFIPNPPTPFPHLPRLGSEREGGARLPPRHGSPFPSGARHERSGEGRGTGG